MSEGKFSRGLAATINVLEALSHAYSSILFANKPFVGFLFILASFWFPNAGLAGLIAAITGLVFARLLRFPNSSSGLYIYNSLLVGLSLGIVYRLDIYLLCLIVLGAILAVLLTVALADLFWRMEHLPVLSAPFVLVALTTAFAAQGYGSLSRYLYPMAPQNPLFTPYIDLFLTSLGAAFFIPHPIPGLLFFIGVFWASSYLAFLSVAGFVVGYSFFNLLSSSSHSVLVTWSGFNIILATMAVGGIFTVPSWQSFLLALVAAAMTALVNTAAGNVMLVYGLPVMAIPFLLITFTVLIALRKRLDISPPYLLLERPDLPQASYERARLIRARGGEPNSVPLRPPFLGTWDVYQGFDGKHTHQPPWQHALDFYIVDQGRSFRNDGTELKDYHCFDLPVLSPCYGTVARFFDDLEDNPPSEVDTKHNWGNFILILLDSGLYVLLAHLRKESVSVAKGERLVPGQVIARCGNTGRSPQPHLHLHVQQEAYLGSPTLPFHLIAINIKKEEEKEWSFQLNFRPEEGMRIHTSKGDTPIAKALHFPIGRRLVYKVRRNNSEWAKRELIVKVSLEGRFQFESDTGSCVCFSENAGVLAFFDRSGGRDAFLDMWILSLGLSPLTESELSWEDSPGQHLWPRSMPRRLLLSCMRPLGGGILSRYHRKQIENNWTQTATHELNIIPGMASTAYTEAVISEKQGCTLLSLKSNGYVMEAKLHTTAQIADGGVPEWERFESDY